MSEGAKGSAITARPSTWELAGEAFILCKSTCGSNSSCSVPLPDRKQLLVYSKAKERKPIISVFQLSYSELTCMHQHKAPSFLFMGLLRFQLFRCCFNSRNLRWSGRQPFSRTHPLLHGHSPRLPSSIGKSAYFHPKVIAEEELP